MEVRSTAKYLRVQPRKVRIIADQVRGENAGKAAALLRFHTSKSAHLLHKVLMSAVANAVNNNGMNPDKLTISTIMVDEGPSFKRMQARAMGRGNRILKKTSHITVGVEEGDGIVGVRPHGTKAKARPTFGAAKKKGKKAPAAAEAPLAEAAPEEVTEVLEETPVAEETVATEEVAAEETATEAPASDDKEDK